MTVIKKINFYMFSKIRILKYKFLSEAKLRGNKPILNAPALFSGKGEIIIGDNVRFGYVSSAHYYSHYGYIEARTEASKIKIGNNVIINNNCNIVAVNQIEIGDDCIIGINFSVIDSDFHHLDINKRFEKEPPSKPVKIGKNVFIGNNVTVLKGVVISDNTVIGNGSIVSSSIPENVIAAGNPARIIKKL